MKKLLVIGLTWPEPSTTAAGNRMLQLLHFFADAGYQIVFGSASKETEYTMDLLGMGISKMPLVLNHASFDAFLMDLKPDVVLFDRFLTEEQFGWRVKQQLPETLRILNTEDLHSLRQAREKALISDQEFSNTAWAQADVTKREIASIYRSDLSLIVSDHEMRLLTQDLKIDPALVFHLPFMLNGITKTVAQKWPLFQERKDFITYGNGKHAPNRDAIRYLKNTIWPLIRKRMPQARIWIYGAYLPNDVNAFHTPDEGFLIGGWADDLAHKIQAARVMLAPLRFGAGIKGKLALAMQCGTPNVTTGIGAEGMSGDLPWSGYISATAEEFAEKAVDLYQKREEWDIAQQQGLQIINICYNKAKLRRGFSEVLEQLSCGLNAYRQKNFIGQMLWHHTLTSTKYMGKWIEEKHRKD